MDAHADSSDASRIRKLVRAAMDLALVVLPQALLPPLGVRGDVGLGAVLAALLGIDEIHPLHAKEAVAEADVVPVCAAALGRVHADAAGRCKTDESYYEKGSHIAANRRGVLLFLRAALERPLFVFPPAVLPTRHVVRQLGNDTVLAALVVVEGVHRAQAGGAVTKTDVKPFGAATFAGVHGDASSTPEGGDKQRQPEPQPTSVRVRYPLPEQGLYAHGRPARPRPWRGSARRSLPRGTGGAHPVSG